MKKIILTLAFVLFMAGAAWADTFTLSSYDVSLNTSDPGLVLYWNPILTQPATWDLSVGGNTGWFDLFTVGTTESTVNLGEDTAQKPISVSFNWSAPTGTVPDTVNGETNGWTIFIIDGGIVDWDDSPAIFNFGSGGQFTLALQDGNFGVPGSTDIKAKLTYVSASSRRYF